MVLANTRKVLTGFSLSMGAMFIHDSCMSVFDDLKSLDNLYNQLCKIVLARLLQGKNFDNDNQIQKQKQMIMRIIFNTTCTHTKTLRRVSKRYRQIWEVYEIKGFLIYEVLVRYRWLS